MTFDIKIILMHCCVSAVSVKGMGATICLNTSGICRAVIQIDFRLIHGIISAAISLSVSAIRCLSVVMVVRQFVRFYLTHVFLTIDH